MKMLHLYSLCFPIPHPPHSPLQTYDILHTLVYGNSQSKIQFYHVDNDTWYPKRRTDMYKR